MARKRYENFVQDSAGNTIVGASASFYIYDGDYPPAAFANIYTAGAGGSPISGSMVTSDGDGKFSCYLEDGRYDVKLEETLLGTIWLKEIESIAYAETERTDNKGIANGYCSLNSDSLIPKTNLPVEGLRPTGEISMFAGNVAPSGWVMCYGQSVSSGDALYTNLWNVIHTTYGSTGSPNFNLPDMRGRFPMGYGTGTTRRGANQISSIAVYGNHSLGATQIILDTYLASWPNMYHRGNIWLSTASGYANNEIIEYTAIFASSPNGNRLGLTLKSALPAAIANGTIYQVIVNQGPFEQGTGRLLGTSIGFENIQLQIPELPGHVHRLGQFNWVMGGYAGLRLDNSYGNVQDTSYTGGSKHFDIINPGLVVNFIIKL